VVAVAERLGDGEAQEVGGARVVGVVEEAVGGVGGTGNAIFSGCGVERVGFAEAFVAAGVGVAQDAGEQADGGVEDDGGAEFAAGEDVVADGELLVAEELADALVDAFVAAADEDDSVERGEAAGGGLREAFALRGEEDYGFACCVAGGFGGAVPGIPGLRRWAGVLRPCLRRRRRDGHLRCGGGHG
jgi:hypothetical protein